MKDISKNFVLSITGKLVLMITGFVVQRAILNQFGSDINGLTSTVTQILSYMSLLEAGLGAASIQALYAPLNNHDWKTVNGILSATNRQYFKTGLMFFGILIGIAILIPVIVTGDIPAISMGILTLLIGMSNVLSYIFMGKYTAILTADKRLYAINTADIFAMILSCVCRLFAIYHTNNIILVQLVHLISIALKIIVIHLYVKKRYKAIDLREKPNYSAVSKRWSVLVHNIASMVVNHTDVIILSVATNLKVVSVYSVYNYVFSNLYSLMNAGFSQAPLAMFGRWYQEDKNKFVRGFGIYDTFFQIAFNTVLFTAGVMILPFVRIYTHDVSDIAYVDPKLAILFLITSYMNIVRLPSVVTINATGAFRETQNGAVIEAVINIVVSLLLLKPLGIYGLLLGTVASYLYRTVDVMRYAYINVLELSFPKQILKVAMNIFVGTLLAAVLYPFVKNAGDSWLRWITYSVVAVVLFGLLFSLVNCFLNKRSIKAYVKEERKLK